MMAPLTQTKTMLKTRLRKLRNLPRPSPGALALLLVLLAAVLVAYLNYQFWHYTEWRVAVMRDSGGYIDWYALRTPGYPAFLSLVKWLSGNLHWAGLAQLNLLLLSYLALAYHFARLLNSRACGVVLLLLLCGIVPLINLSSHIMTETLFTAMICLHLASLCFYLRRRSLLAAVFVGATVFLICIVRPNGLPFAASLLLLAAMNPTPPRSVREKGHGSAAANDAALRRPADCHGPIAFGLGQQDGLWRFHLAADWRADCRRLCGAFVAGRRRCGD